MASAISILPWQASENEDGDSRFEKILSGIHSLEHGQQRIETAIKKLDGRPDLYGGNGNFGNSDVGSQGNEQETVSEIQGQRQISGQSFTVFGGLEDVQHRRKSCRYSLASYEAATNPRESAVYGTDSIFGKVLDRNWPSTIQARDEAELFEFDDVDGKCVRKAMARRRQGGTTSYTLRKATSACDVSDNERVYVGFEPSGLFLLLKDWIAIVALFNDLVVMPYMVAWNLDINQGWRLMVLAWWSASFWTVDIGLNFVSGIVLHGEVILSLKKVSWRYLTRWFLFDASLTASDWITIALAVSSGQAGQTLYDRLQVVKILRWARMCRNCRAGRLVKLLEYGGCMRWNQSSLRRAATTVLDMLIWIFLGAHMLACFFYRMGVRPWDEKASSWLDLPSGAATTLSFRESGDMQQYLASAQFIMALITLGASDVLPQNSPERLFNIVMLMVGFFAGTTIISMMSGSVVHYVLSIQEQAQTMAKLRQFLHQNRIHHSLAMEITTQASVRMHDEQIIREEDVELLKHLPSTILTRLMYETRLPRILKHPLFELWAAMDSEAIMEFCTKAVTEKFCLPRDEVFNPHTACEVAYVVMLGELRYEQSPEMIRYAAKIDPAPIIVPVSTDAEDSWICEAALWSHWFHVGTLIADTACQVMVINAVFMWEILDNYREIGAATAGYCINFYNRLVAAIPPHAVYPTDISIQPYLDRHELLDQQVGIGLLHQAMSRDKVVLSREQYEELKSELVSHKCILQQPNDGVFKRIVAVEALLVTNARKQYFIQIGEWDYGGGRGIKAVCQYPAKKRTMDELPQDTLRRLLYEDLKPFDDLITIDRSVKEVEEKDSKKLSFPTTYNRTVHVASLANEEKLNLAVVKGSSELPASLKSFPKRELYIVPSSVSDKLGFYVWMSETEFRRMKGDVNLQGLQAWLSSFSSPTILNANI